MRIRTSGRNLSRNILAAVLSLASLLTASDVAMAQRVLGADISYWNCGTSSTGISQTNWNTAYTTGHIEFVFIRATRGGTTGVDQPSGTPGNPTTSTLSRRYDDSRFIQNITRATAAGMLAGPYHFGRADVVADWPVAGQVPNNGTDEANHFIEMAGAFMRPGYLMPVYDFEAGLANADTGAPGSPPDYLAQFTIDF